MAIVSQKCPGCGASLKPEDRILGKCQYCGTAFTVERDKTSGVTPPPFSSPPPYGAAPYAPPPPPPAPPAYIPPRPKVNVLLAALGLIFILCRE